MKKFLLIFFLTALFLGTIGVKNSSAATALISPVPVDCCPAGTDYSEILKACCATGGICNDPVLSKKIPTYCGSSACIDMNNNVLNRHWVCEVVKTDPSFDPCKNLSGPLTGNSNGPELKCRNCTGIQPDGSFSGVCPGADNNQACGTWTSLGCIPNDPPALVGYVLKFGTGIAGGIAFLLILFGAGQIVMSGGVPEKIGAGKEVITSAVIGLVFIFVSVLVLQIIGVKIIGIPGWV